MLELIEIANWKRVKYFDLFVTNGNLINNAAVLFDCTQIYNYAKQQRVPFIVTMLHATLCGMNHLKEFRSRVVNDEYLACYDQINLLTTELSPTMVVFR